MVVVLVLIIAAAIGYLVWVSSKQDWAEPTESPPTEEELLQARLDIAKVEKGIDLALSKQETRMASARTKEAIAEALVDEQ